MEIPKFKPLSEAGEGTKKVLKPVLIGIVVLLLGAFGLESTNNDWDLGKLLGGSTMKEAKVLRDKQGNVVPEGTVGAKGTDEYNCVDFSTQSEAQTFYNNAGGVNSDVNRLDANKDGVPCESLPKSR
ncbi:MAG: excalibur calcium-binding domain-containing protein [Minisyncoccia bacterium]